ncbi:MAG: hypothetical protein R2795_24975 [Saprospiraceae bacterium]
MSPIKADDKNRGIRLDTSTFVIASVRSDSTTHGCYQPCTYLYPHRRHLIYFRYFNKWKLKDPNFQFKRIGKNRWVYNFLTTMPDFEYKINRGDWESVEGGQFGVKIDNRVYKSKDQETDTIFIEIQSWEDLIDSLPSLDTMTLCIDQIPDQTPDDASFYVAGTFNGWYR